MENHEKFPSKSAYYHDQKGIFHPPEQIVVPPYSAATAAEQIKFDKIETEAIQKLTLALENSTDDPKAVKLIREIITSAKNYAEAVINYGQAREESGEVDPEIFRQNMSYADKRRRQIHEVLIGDLAKYDRYLRQKFGLEPKLRDEGEEEDEAVHKTPEEIAAIHEKIKIRGIYSYPSLRRDFIGEWAIHLAAAIAKLDEGSDLVKKLSKK